MFDMHVLIVNTERYENIALCSESLSRGRHLGASDEPECLSRLDPAPLSPSTFAGQAYSNPQARRHVTSAGGNGSEEVSR